MSEDFLGDGGEMGMLVDGLWLVGGLWEFGCLAGLVYGCVQ